jgi:Sec-independent protein translocase protein TatA
MSNRIGAAAIVLMFGTGMTAAAGQLGGVVDATKGAAKTAGDVGEKAVKTTEKGTKKAAKATKKTVTGDAHATCVDGTRQTGKTEAAAAGACANHGGVAKK